MKDGGQVNGWCGGADPALMRQTGNIAHRKDGELPLSGDALTGDAKRGNTSGGKQAMAGSSRADQNTTNAY